MKETTWNKTQRCLRYLIVSFFVLCSLAQTADSQTQKTFNVKISATGQAITDVKFMRLDLSQSAGFLIDATHPVTDTYPITVTWSPSIVACANPATDGNCWVRTNDPTNRIFTYEFVGVQTDTNVVNIPLTPSTQIAEIKVMVITPYEVDTCGSALNQELTSGISFLAGFAATQEYSKRMENVTIAYNSDGGTDCTYVPPGGGVNGITSPKVAIDAREPNPAGQLDVHEGWDYIDLRFETAITCPSFNGATPPVINDFLITEQDGVDTAVPIIASCNDSTNYCPPGSIGCDGNWGTNHLRLHFAPTPEFEFNVWTILTHTPSSSKVWMGRLPCDVDGDGQVSPTGYRVDIAGGTHPFPGPNPPAEPAGDWTALLWANNFTPRYQADLNRDGVFDPNGDRVTLEKMLKGDGFTSCRTYQKLPPRN